MYIVDNGFGEPLKEPWRVRVGLRPRPLPHLRFLSLDNFGTDKSLLTADHLKKIRELLVPTIAASWKTMQPIDLIRVVGHTDDTGPEKHNLGLGDRRAEAVAAELLKIYPRSGRVQIALETSPGESQPTADNRTTVGRARNRRVEIFIVSGGVPVPKKPVVIPWPPVVKDHGDSVIVTKPDPMWDRIPPGSSKSLKDQLVDLCARHLPSSACSTTVNQIVKGGCFALEQLLSRAGATLSEKQREQFREQCRDAAKKPIR